MSTTFSQPGDVLNWTNSTGSAVVAGEAVIASTDTAGVSQENIGNGAIGRVAIVGIHNLAKATSETWAVGDKLYWSTSAGNASKTPAAARFFIGVADQIAGSSATVGRVRLCKFKEGGATVLTLTATTTLAAHHFAGGGVAIDANTAGGAITVNLPALPTVAGSWLSVRRTGAGGNAVTLDPAGSETLDAATVDAAGDRVLYFAHPSTWSLNGSTIA